MGKKMNIKDARNKARSERLNSKGIDYEKILELQNKRERLLKEKISIEKKFSMSKGVTDENSRVIRFAKIKLENVGRQLKDKLTELNLLEERLLILERDPVYDVLSRSEEQLKKLHSCCREISVKTVIVSKNINNLRRNINSLISGTQDFSDVKKNKINIPSWIVLKDPPWEKVISLQERINGRAVKGVEDVRRKSETQGINSRRSKKKEEALFIKIAESGAKKRSEPNIV